MLLPANCSSSNRSPEVGEPELSVWMPPSDESPPHLSGLSRVPSVIAWARGCRCPDCCRLAERAQAWVRRRTRGEQVSSIAATDAVTRNRVSLDTRAMAPDEPWLASRSTRPSATPCRVCGNPVDGHGNRRTCEGACAGIYSALRYHVDERSRASALRRTARWRAQLHEAEPSQELRGRAGLDVAAQPRAVRVGSAAWDAAVTARSLGLPIFERLPADLQERVRAAVADR